MQVFSFRNIRIVVLLILLGTVALYAKDQRLVTQGWYKTLDVVVYPINVENSRTVERYIQSLSSRQFEGIDEFIQRESKKYNVIASVPTKTRLGQTLAVSPPPPPRPGSSALSNIFWSIKLRWWVWKNAPQEPHSKYLIRMFVQYHEPKNDASLLHSVGLQKGLVGIVNAFGVRSQNRQNNIIIAHEFLHTVGASDKYNESGLPRLPDGYADPGKVPLYPQKKAEIMAGKRAISADYAEMPDSLRYVVIGPRTAQEIGWRDDV